MCYSVLFCLPLGHSSQNPNDQDYVPSVFPEAYWSKSVNLDSSRKRSERVAVRSRRMAANNLCRIPVVKSSLSCLSAIKANLESLQNETQTPESTVSPTQDEISLPQHNPR